MGFLERFIDFGVIPVLSIATFLLILPLPYKIKKLLMLPLNVQMQFGTVSIGVFNILIAGSFLLLSIHVHKRFQMPSIDYTEHPDVVLNLEEHRNRTERNCYIYFLSIIVSGLYLQVCRINEKIEEMRSELRHLKVD